MTTPAGPWQTATIAINTTTSDVINLQAPFGQVLIVLPDMTGSTVTVQVADVTGAYSTLDKPNGGGSMTLPKAKAHCVDLYGAQRLKIVSASSEGAARTILLVGI